MKRLDRALRVASCLMLLALGGCNAGRSFIAWPDDYADYRSVRLADSYDERMAHAWHYLKAHPEGRYAERLRRYFARAEPVYFKVRMRNIAGLEAYLRALPDGPHAAEALERLTALKGDRRREELDTRAARRTQLRLDADKRRQAAAAELVEFWTRALLDPEAWRRPFGEAPGELMARWRLALPEPVCERDDPEPGQRRCGKSVTLGYPIRVGRERRERDLSLDIELVLDGGWRLSRAMMTGPKLFVKSEEAREGRSLDGADPSVQRAAAERFVARLTQRLFAEERECNGGTDANEVTLLVCDELRITIDPGMSEGDDSILIEPAGSAAK